MGADFIPSKPGSRSPYQTVSWGFGVLTWKCGYIIGSPCHFLSGVGEMQKRAYLLFASICKDRGSETILRAKFKPCGTARELGPGPGFMHGWCSPDPSYIFLSLTHTHENVKVKSLCGMEWQES